MVKSLMNGHSRTGFENEQLANEVLALLGNVGKRCIIHVPITVSHVSQCLFVVLPAKR